MLENTLQRHKNDDGKDSLSAHSLLQCRTKGASNDGSKRHVQITTKQTNGKDTQELLKIPALDKEICFFCFSKLLFNIILFKKKTPTHLPLQK